MEKKKKILVTLFALVLLLSVIAVTYAYFATATDNSNAQSASVQAGTMQLTFADNDAGVSGNLGIGESITKKFTISNTGSLDAYAKINWYNLVNTYTNRSLTYTLEYSESQNGTYKALVSNANVPVSSTASTQLLASPIKVPVGKTYYYNLTITLNNLADVDQTADYNATMSSNFTIESIKPNVGEETLATLGLTAKMGTPDFNSISFEACYYNGVEVLNIFGSTPNEESCTKIYNTYTLGYFDKTAEYLYVGEAEWSNDTCLYNGNPVISAKNANKENFLASENECGKTYQYPNGNDIIYVTGIEEMGPGLWITSGDTGIYAMADDYGTSYYFRGAVTNNYVKFAGFYWRIIRINGDGSIRMIYDGTQAYANGTSDTARYVTTEAFNSTPNHNAYVGYMYGSTSGSTYEEIHANTNSSTIKTYLEDTWYKTNIEDKGYSKYLSDEIFCNDRSLSSRNGIGTNYTEYAAHNRLYTNKTPQLTCPQKNDAFTVSDTKKGNGALKYPVGLITADEVVLAGGKWWASDYSSNNSSYYLYKGDDYWSLSPFYFSGSSASVLIVSNHGYLGGSHVHIVNNGVAPVINISPEYALQMTGSGTASDPFTQYGGGFEEGGSVD